MVRIGLAGLGFMGYTHLTNYLKHPEARIVALADAQKDRSKGHRPAIEVLADTEDSASKLSDVKSYDSYVDLNNDPDVDVVAICLPTDMHVEAVVGALEAGKHVFCEKPMALDVAGGKQMVEAARRTGKTLMIGHVLRFWPEYIAAREIIHSGQYGKVLSAAFHRCSGAPAWADWFRSRKRSGGVMLDLHIHDADLCVWYWGKPSDIRATAAWHQDTPCISHCHWQYDGGPDVIFQSSWEPAAKAPFYFGFRVSMEGATLLFDSRNSDGLVLADNEEAREVKVENTPAYEIEDNYFVDAIAEGKPVDRCPPEESLITMECLVEEMRQIERG